MQNTGLSVQKNILWNSAGSIIALGCNWLMTIMVVRLSNGYDSAGVLALAMTIGNIFTPFATYKMRTYQISDVDNEYSAGEYLTFRVATTSLALAGCVIYAIVTCQQSAICSIVLFLLYKCIDQITDVMHGVDQKHQRMDYIGVSLATRGILGLLAFCCVLRMSNDLNLAIIAMIVSNLPITIGYDYRKARQFCEFSFGISLSRMKRLFQECFTAVLSAVFCSAVLTVPRQLLSYLFGDATLGIYASIAAPVTLVQMGATYIYIPLLGEFSGYFRDGRKAEFEKLLGKVTIGIVLVALGCIALFTFFGEWGLVLLLGDSIVPYVYLLRPAILCTVITAYLWFMSDLFVSIRCFRENFAANLISVIASLAASFPCVSIWDMNGVSYSGIIGYGAGVIVMLVCLKRILRSLEAK